MLSCSLAGDTCGAWLVGGSGGHLARRLSDIFDALGTQDVVAGRQEAPPHQGHGALLAVEAVVVPLTLLKRDVLAPSQTWNGTVTAVLWGCQVNNRDRNGIWFHSWWKKVHYKADEALNTSLNLPYTFKNTERTSQNDLKTTYKLVLILMRQKLRQKASVQEDNGRPASHGRLS